MVHHITLVHFRAQMRAQLKHHNIMHLKKGDS